MSQVALTEALLNERSVEVTTYLEFVKVAVERRAVLTAKDGALERISESATALTGAADAFSASTLPRVNQASDDTARAAKQLGRAANAVSDNPQLLIFGNSALKPGPGEPGFAAPGAKP